MVYKSTDKTAGTTTYTGSAGVAIVRHFPVFGDSATVFFGREERGEFISSWSKPSKTYKKASSARLAAKCYAGGL